MTLTFEKVSGDGIPRVEITPYYFIEYLDGQFLRRGLIGDINVFVEDLYEAGYHEVL